ncbi:tRNA threonylcarbamoyladenosine dehydratase [Kaistella jeonii]|uniref:Thiamine biosynthesis protein ThiF n=1 Tax=Kaistella jeonii TaxID=266749 RepID=A0A0C1CY43_9FLAO|nr:tRNA threonylcarbamoyladenosine dehydratase [Kaistella jeonii]KIA89286.1 thiamine biosynthesis protein ThiF [Kaistella jeonii]SFC01918.1 tRNA A37 threonylcarbamoyladenosine dehydratase [Kaistella jeonii]VEI96597.1 Molybdopterin-synthase adenylyltransferase [Kaistella jeonii]
MQKNWLERTELLIKGNGIEKLQNANLLIVGLGGVGSFAAEFLARAGVGKMTIVDGDIVDITNINRQLPALHSTIGKSKVEIVAERLLDINPKLELLKINEFLNPEKMEEVIDSQKFNYILDCIDSVTPKVTLLLMARRRKIKVVSCMGAGGKVDPAKVMVRDISKTYNCFLAKQVRKRLKKENIDKGIRCVFSNEIQSEESLEMTDGANYKRSFYGTISYIPAIFGLYAAAEVINYIIEKDE